MSFYPAVDGVDFDLAAGESLAIIGESGCGKTLLARALLDLAPEGARVSGDIRLRGSLASRPSRKVEWCRVRGARSLSSFRSPASALDPVRTVGDQIVEAIRAHERVTAEEAREAARRSAPRGLLSRRGARSVANIRIVCRAASGSARFLAIALAANPKVLIADEPTSSLDATIAAEVLELLDGPAAPARVCP